MLKDSPSTVLPIIQELMRCGIRVYICRYVVSFVLHAVLSWCYRIKLHIQLKILPPFAELQITFSCNKTCCFEYWISFLVYICGGDSDDRVPTRSTGYSMNKLGAQVNTPWYPWYTQGEVGFWNLSSIHYCLRRYLVSDGIWLNLVTIDIHFSCIKHSLSSLFLDGKLPSQTRS